MLAVGWDVGGWMGDKNAVALALWKDGSPVPHPCGTPCCFTLPDTLMSPLELVRKACSTVTQTDLDRLRVVIAIDAPLGFPYAFRRLVNGTTPSSGRPKSAINSPLAYRETERYVQRVFRRTPLSAPFDKLGNNATVAIAHMQFWRRSHWYRVPPFDAPGDHTKTAIEVYPAISGEMYIGKGAADQIKQLVPEDPPLSQHESDAAVCAALAMAFVKGSPDGPLPPLVNPKGIEGITDGILRVEGWIYNPAKA